MGFFNHGGGKRGLRLAEKSIAYSDQFFRCILVPGKV